MGSKALALTVLGAAAIVAGVLFIVGENLPGWVPDWDGEMRLVVGLGIAFGGFVVLAMGALGLVAGMQSMPLRLERHRRGGSRPPGGTTLLAMRTQSMSGLMVTGSLAVGVAGGFFAWMEPLPEWMSWAAGLETGYRLLIGGALMVFGLIGLVCFGASGKVSGGGAPPPDANPEPAPDFRPPEFQEPPADPGPA